MTKNNIELTKVVQEMREHASEVFFSTLNEWATRIEAAQSAEMDKLRADLAWTRAALERGRDWVERTEVENDALMALVQSGQSPL